MNRGSVSRATVSVFASRVTACASPSAEEPAAMSAHSSGTGLASHGAKASGACDLACANVNKPWLRRREECSRLCLICSLQRCMCVPGPRCCVGCRSLTCHGPRGHSCCRVCAVLPFSWAVHFLWTQEFRLVCTVIPERGLECVREVSDPGTQQSQA